MQGSQRGLGRNKGMSRAKALAAAVIAGIALGAATPAVFAGNGELTLAELKKVLAGRPDAKWQAADTGAAGSVGTPVVTESGAVSGVNFGLRDWQGPRKKTQLERARVDEPTPALPRKWDWRNATVGGVTGDFMSPVRNQGKCGSCVSFATAAAFEGTLAVASGTPRLDANVSEQDIFINIGSCDFGSWPTSGMSHVTQEGVPDEACHPYTMGRLGKDGDADDACKDRSARLIKASDDDFASSPSAIKQALMTGPMQTTMSVYEDFMFYSGGIYKHVTGAMQGGHAITLVGYNDDERYWIAKNSWGTGWGEAGYFRISYDDVSGFADDAYGFTVNGNEVTMRLDTPRDFSAINGKVPLEVSVFDSAVETINWELASADQQWLQGRAHHRFKGEFKPTLEERNGARVFRGTIDTTPMDDGISSLALEAVAKGSSKGRKVYSRFVIVNHPVTNPSDGLVAITPDFDNAQPVKARVYFKFDAHGLAAAQKAPLTHAELVINGPKAARLRFEDPGTEAMFGWRTQMFGDGTYKIHVEGFVGDQQMFKSNELEVKVQNK